jgi:hypothetical protein
VNHLKSKGYGIQAENDAKRLRQATRVAAMYEELHSAGEKEIAIVGDFNDFPTSEPLQPLFAGTDLRDVGSHPNFTADPERPGTFGNLHGEGEVRLHPPLAFALREGHRRRRSPQGGLGRHQRRSLAHYPEIERQVDQASDQAAIYADLAI